MADKNFPTDFNDRGTVKTTDKLFIHNIDTGLTEFTTVAGLFASITTALGLKAPLNSPVFVNGISLGEDGGATTLDFLAWGDKIEITAAGMAIKSGSNIMFHLDINENETGRAYIFYNHDDVEIGRLDEDGNFTVTGVVSASGGDSDDWNAKQNAITGGTSAPTGGVDGDVYFQYEELA
jgi:hypothetical protein